MKHQRYSWMKENSLCSPCTCNLNAIMLLLLIACKLRSNFFCGLVWISGDLLYYRGYFGCPQGEVSRHALCLSIWANFRFFPLCFCLEAHGPHASVRLRYIMDLSLLQLSNLSSCFLVFTWSHINDIPTIVASLEFGEGRWTRHLSRQPKLTEGISCWWCSIPN